MQTTTIHYSNRRHVCELALVAFFFTLSTTPALAQVAQSEVPVLSKPALAVNPGSVGTQQTDITTASSKGTANQTNTNQITTYWYDGSRKRMLTIDRSSIADFGSLTKPKSAPEITTSEILSSKAKSDSRTSPMLRNAQSGQLAGALAGGVLVRMTRAVEAEDAQAMAKAFGATVKHPLGTATSVGHELWLFDSPAGLASLELANRIHESGQVKSAAPNWWKPRALK